MDADPHGPGHVLLWDTQARRCPMSCVVRESLSPTQPSSQMGKRGLREERHLPPESGEQARVDAVSDSGGALLVRNPMAAPLNSCKQRNVLLYPAFPELRGRAGRWRKAGGGQPQAPRGRCHPHAYRWVEAPSDTSSPRHLCPASHSSAKMSSLDACSLKSCDFLICRRGH